MGRNNECKKVVWRKNDVQGNQCANVKHYIICVHTRDHTCYIII